MGMFEWIREHKRLMLGALVVLIFPSFVFWGISGYEQFIGDSGEVARVDGRPISREAYERAHREQLERARNALGASGSSIDLSVLDTPEFRQSVLDGLIHDVLLARLVEERRVVVSNLRLQDAIASISNLRKPDGRFDLEQYRALLAARGQSEVQFEEGLRADMARDAYLDALGASGFAPRAVALKLASAQQQQREIRQLLLPVDRYRKSIKATDEELAAYFAKHQQRYEEQAQADLEVLTLSLSALEASMQDDDAAIKAYYEQNQQRFGEPEQRRASHILLDLPAASDTKERELAREKVLAQARELVQSLRKGADFGALARQYSKDSGSASQGGDLGFFAREAMVRSFADAAFSLKAGDISDPVESEFGVHIIRLQEVRPGRVKPLEQVRGEIAAQFRRELAQKRFAELAESFSNIVYEQSDSLKPAADKFGLSITRLEGVRADGSLAKGAGAERVALSPRILRAAFAEDAIKQRRNTEALESAPGTLVSVRTDQYRAARIPALNEVRERVVGDHAEELAMAMAQKDGELLVRQINDAPADARALQAAGFSAVQRVARQRGAGLDPGSLNEVFRIPAEPGQKPRAAGLQVPGQGYRVLVLLSVVAADAGAVDAVSKAVAPQLASLEGGVMADAFVRALRSRVKVETFPTRLSAQR